MLVMNEKANTRVNRYFNRHEIFKIIEKFVVFGRVIFVRT